MEDYQLYYLEPTDTRTTSVNEHYSHLFSVSIIEFEQVIVFI